MRMMSLMMRQPRKRRNYNCLQRRESKHKLPSQSKHQPPQVLKNNKKKLRQAAPRLRKMTMRHQTWSRLVISTKTRRKRRVAPQRVTTRQERKKRRETGRDQRRLRERENSPRNKKKRKRRKRRNSSRSKKRYSRKWRTKQDPRKRKAVCSDEEVDIYTYKESTTNYTQHNTSY